MLSGMKINYHKSEVVVMGGFADEQAGVARAVKCLQGKFPFTYLGFTMSDHKLNILGLEPVVAKVGFRMDPLQGRSMSAAAHLTLIDACLSSIPNYTTGLILLPEDTHTCFYKHPGRFFWEGKGNKRKYHMVSWQNIFKPREQGGLGAMNIMNTKLMNMCLWLNGFCSS